MKKKEDLRIGICTLYGNYNFGNKLQNYALQEVLKEFSDNVITFRLNNQNIKGNIVELLSKLKSKDKVEVEREKKFLEFNKNINYSKHKINVYYPLMFRKIDIMFYGSDQVWNPYYCGLSKLMSGDYGNFMKVSYAASFGVSKLLPEHEEKFKKGLKKFSFISVREDKGKEFVEKIIEKRDVEVLVDPTLLIDKGKWSEIATKPKEIVPKKYILCYFLGSLSDNSQKEIERVAAENECEIINILDKKDKFYLSGPGEFLYLEEHAHLICTDSFHSCVFAFLFDRPFIIFDKEQDRSIKMNSRIDTLLSKFDLKSRRYDGKRITENNLCHNYVNSYKLLELEISKSHHFFEKVFKSISD